MTCAGKKGTRQVPVESSSRGEFFGTGYVCMTQTGMKQSRNPGRPHATKCSPEFQEQFLSIWAEFPRGIFREKMWLEMKAGK